MRFVILGSLIATSLSSAACHTIKPVTLDELGGMRPDVVWVTRADNSVVAVSGPRMYGDTLVGYVNGQFEEMPVAGLKQLVARRPARGKTTALIAAGAVGAAAMVILVSGGGGYTSPCSMMSSECNPNGP